MPSLKKKRSLINLQSKIDKIDRSNKVRSPKNSNLSLQYSSKGHICTDPNSQDSLQSTTADCEAGNAFATG